MNQTINPSASARTSVIRPCTLFISLMLMAFLAALGWADTADHLARGKERFKKGEYDDAIKEFSDVIRRDPKNPAGYLERGRVWAKKREYDKALHDLNEALRLAPHFFPGYFERGHLWVEMREYDKAIGDFSDVIRLAPEAPAGYFGRGHAWFETREYDKAIGDFSDVIRLAPKNPWSHLVRGQVWDVTQDCAKAVRDFTEALRLDPLWAEAYNSLAWVLATCAEAKHRDAHKAAALARKACEISGWNNPPYLASLAAAYAESGQFDQAITYQQQALKFPTYEKSEGTSARERLTLYQQKKPYHRTPPAAKTLFEALLARVNQRDKAVDFQALRFAYTETAHYHPYSPDRRTAHQAMYSALNNQEYEKALAYSHQLLATTGVDLDAHLVACRAQKQLANAAQATCHQDLLKGLIQSIQNSGNGESPATAFVVISTDEEYFLLEQVFGLQVLRQELVEAHGHWYDKMTAVDPETHKQRTLYFNIDRPYRWLALQVK
jgi:tetratricopeptide (TPR) repeat protein